MLGDVIIMEGTDAVGKTTLAKLIAEKIGGIYCRTPPDCFREKCRIMDSRGIIYDEARFLLYLESVIFTSKEIEKFIENGQPIVIDRWIWTTFAYHFAFNAQLYKKWQNNWPSLTTGLIKPKLQILLLIPNDEIWLKRITERGIDKCDKLLVENPALRKSIIQLYKNLNPNFQLVENSGTIENTLENILSLWSRSQKKSAI